MGMVSIDGQVLQTLIDFADRRFNNAEITTDGYLAVPDAIISAKRAITHPVKPTIVANITGGVLQGWNSNVPADLYCLDFEVDLSHYPVALDGDHVSIMSTCGATDPEFIAKVRDLYDYQTASSKIL